MEYAQIVRMGYIIQRFLEKNVIFDAQPVDLMQLLIDNGFFKYDIREGKPLRDILRKLDDCNMLYLLPQVRVDRMEIKRQWYFNVFKA